MTTENLDESSPSVQTHLGILQGVISRMAVNSGQCKAFCITIVSAILVVIADKDKPEYAWLALIPIILFMFLDMNYLALERQFREAYNNFVKKLHRKELKPEDLYSVKPEGDFFKHRRESFTSFSIAVFYIGLGSLVGVAKYLIF